MTTPWTSADFVTHTVDWINRALVPRDVTVTADTPLFATGIINSIRVLELIAWTERAIGHEIPDTSIRMDNFRTVRRIAEVFATPSSVTNGGAHVAA